MEKTILIAYDLRELLESAPADAKVVFYLDGRKLDFQEYWYDDMQHVKLSLVRAEEL